MLLSYCEKEKDDADMSWLELEGESVIVTGGAMGIGLTI
jgi:hypothetical protein